VFVGLPNLRDHDKYLNYLPSVLYHIKEQDCPVKVLKPYITPSYSGKFHEGNKDKLLAITNRLNNIIDEFMKTDASHLWIIDMDTEVPKHALCTLLKLNADIASGVYPFHNIRNSTMFGRTPSTEEYYFIPGTIDRLRGRVIGEEEMVSGGNGCMLIKRRVFQRYHPNIEPMRFTCPGGKGSDTYFWWRAQKAGFTARIDGDVICGHLPEHSLIEMKKDFPP